MRSQSRTSRVRSGGRVCEPRLRYFRATFGAADVENHAAELPSGRVSSFVLAPETGVGSISTNLSSRLSRRTGAQGRTTVRSRCSASRKNWTASWTFRFAVRSTCTSAADCPNGSWTACRNGTLPLMSDRGLPARYRKTCGLGAPRRRSPTLRAHLSRDLLPIKNPLTSGIGDSCGSQPPSRRDRSHGPARGVPRTCARLRAGQVVHVPG